MPHRLGSEHRPMSEKLHMVLEGVVLIMGIILIIMALSLVDVG